MVITAEKGRQNKMHISVDGKYLFTVDAEYWFSSPYCRKSEIDDEDEQEEFYIDVGSRSAFVSGLGILSYGDNSRKELRTKLVTRGHKAEYVELALDKLEEFSYINDERFARNLTERLITQKHMSKNGIKSELLQKGISREITDRILEETEFDPVESICELLTSKYKRYLNDEKGKKKAVSAVLRLGYSWSDIRSAMNRLDMESGEFDD